MQNTNAPNTYGAGLADSDSVNLGSNPSSPATDIADLPSKSGPGHSGHSGQTAHSGRTEVGTATVGPWRVEGPDIFGDFNVIPPHEVAAVAAVVSNVRAPDEVAANARLIAAAPEMLTALIANTNNLRTLADVLRDSDPKFAALIDWNISANDLTIARATGAPNV